MMTDISDIIFTWFGASITSTILEFLDNPLELGHFIEIQTFAERFFATSYLKNILLPITSIRLHISEENEINLDGYYNLLKNPDRVVDPEKYEKWKNNPQLQGIACGLLLLSLKKMLERKMVNNEAKVTLLAMGKNEKAKNKRDQRELAKYYEKIGFRSDSNYLERYDKAMEELERYGSNEINLGRIVSKYDLDLEFGIPMEGKIIDIIEGLEKNCVKKVKEEDVVVVINGDNAIFNFLKERIEEGEEKMRREIFSTLVI